MASEPKIKMFEKSSLASWTQYMTDRLTEKGVFYTTLQTANARNNGAVANLFEVSNGRIDNPSAAQRNSRLSKDQATARTIMMSTFGKYEDELLGKEPHELWAWAQSNPIVGGNDALLRKYETAIDKLYPENGEKVMDFLDKLRALQSAANSIAPDTYEDDEIMRKAFAKMEDADVLEAARNSYEEKVDRRAANNANQFTWIEFRMHFQKAVTKIAKGNQHGGIPLLDTLIKDKEEEHKGRVKDESKETALLTKISKQLDKLADSGASGRQRLPKSEQPCWSFRDTGKCRYGDECAFSHEQGTGARNQGKHKNNKNNKRKDVAAMEQELRELRKQVGKKRAREEEVVESDSEEESAHVTTRMRKGIIKKPTKKTPAKRNKKTNFLDNGDDFGLVTEVTEKTSHGDSWLGGGRLKIGPIVDDGTAVILAVWMTMVMAGWGGWWATLSTSFVPITLLATRFQLSIAKVCGFVFCCARSAARTAERGLLTKDGAYIIIDSGATTHVVHTKELRDQMTNVKVVEKQSILMNTTRAEIKVRGDLCLKIIDAETGKVRAITLRNVAYVPESKYALLSVSKFLDTHQQEGEGKGIIAQSSEKCSLTTLNGGRVFGLRVENLYCLQVAEQGQEPDEEELETQEEVFTSAEIPPVPVPDSVAADSANINSGSKSSSKKAKKSKSPRGGVGRKAKKQSPAYLKYLELKLQLKKLEEENEELKGVPSLIPTSDEEDSADESDQE